MIRSIIQQYNSIIPPFGPFLVKLPYKAVKIDLHNLSISISLYKGQIYFSIRIQA